ncbi:beta-propeller domain-containing protein [Micromonospora sp. NPDC049497]|uniref:beta-propeller domain-containing protein n=1 Tax=Micromonospora sp. NPDC049497 TaxID=3364273 RepID=UPI00378EA62A
MKRGMLTGGALLTLALLSGSATTFQAADRSATGAVGASAADPAMSAPRPVSYESCAEALADLRSAASASVGPWGFSGEDTTWTGRRLGGPMLAGAARADGDAPEHSTTNIQEVGVDEPDLVKTDGRRIVTVTGQVLRVVDPATRRVVGRLDLTADPENRWGRNELLLHGDRALVLSDVPTPVRPGGERLDGPRLGGTELILVDLAGTPRVLGTYRIQGHRLDARQTGGTARVVVRSAARVIFPPFDGRKDNPDARATEANRAVVATAGLDAWLPAYEWTAGSQRHTGRIGCDRLTRTERATGSGVLTVLSFDLGGGRLGDGDPVSIATHADAVYATGDSLYLAGAREVGDRPDPRRWIRPSGKLATDIHRFDTSAPGRPRYAAAGSVPGWLVNRYAMSEWQGHLRVATTTEAGGRTSESGVHVLRQQGATLVPVGTVTGLGRGERIYSVRYLGATAHVVTFRRTDPLYTLDLTEPAAPRVTGELKITGYSSYLHPVADGRLLGVGQEADTSGRVRGVQVSLFDVRDPTRPTRLDQWHDPDGVSAAEYDPHAFLHDPSTGLVAVPVGDGVRLLRVTGDALTEHGTVSHPSVTRSLLVGGVLWTVSETGLRASDPTTARSLTWLPST